MSDNFSPLLSQSPNDSQNLTSVLSEMLRKFDLQSENVLPAKVISFDRKTNTATVQPLIMVVMVSGKTVPRHDVAEIPVLSLGGGSFNISFPLKPDDLGWIYACDRDMTLFQQSLKESPPNSKRTKCFSQSMFVPDVFRNYTINDEDSGALVIQSVDSATRISIRGDNIKITAPVKVVIDTPETECTGNFTVDGNSHVKGTEIVDGNATFNANASVMAALTVTGATAINGGMTAATGKPCTLPDTTTIGGTNTAGHGHISTTIGTRTSGGMIP